jgi:adenosylcobyric acid synthase
VKGGLLVCGTTSDAGKSLVVTGLCRLLARRGVKVAPFKAQNMSLNSYVTAEGHEIGRAQGAQAMAAGIEAEAAMNPILLKPMGGRRSQVIVNGVPTGHRDFVDYQDRYAQLLPIVLEALAGLRRRFDVVIGEGAGSPAEINLLPRDIVNLRIAAEASLPAVIVGDIERGGVFAALYGTVALLPEDLRATVKGFIINKFRGDPTLLGDGPAMLEARCGVPTLGVVPMALESFIDAEDSLALSAVGRAEPEPARADTLDVAVVRLPRFANFTDLDPLVTEPGVALRLVTHAVQLGDPDLVILPGSKSTLADLDWLRGRGFATAFADRRRRGATVLGICAGYQMLGGAIVDGVESPGQVEGLGLLAATTTFRADKTVRRRRGRALGQVVTGYEIHHGVTERLHGSGWIGLDGDDAGLSDDEGCQSEDGGVLGTNLHGLFEEDGFRSRFLQEVAERRGKSFVPAPRSFATLRIQQYDRMADLLEEHLDLARLGQLIESAG